MYFRYVLIIIVIILIESFQITNKSHGFQIKNDKYFTKEINSNTTLPIGMNQIIKIKNKINSFQKEQFAPQSKVIAKTHSKRIAKRNMENVTNAEKNNENNENFDDIGYFLDELKKLKNIENCTDKSMSQQQRDLKCLCKNNPKCLKFCSYNILVSYLANQDEKEYYQKPVMLRNNTRIAKHLVEDFDIIVEDICTKRIRLDPEINEGSEWTLYQDGTLLRHADKQLFSQNEYCFELVAQTGEYEGFTINPGTCDISIVGTFNTGFSMAISVPFFIFTIITYAIIPQLRSVHGKCFMTYLGSLTVGYSIFAFLNIFLGALDGHLPAYWCRIIGHVIYHFTITQLIWMCCICYDTWQSLTSLSYGNISYFRYSLYGWGVPFIFSLLVLIIQLVNINEQYKPGITGQSCCIDTNRWSAMIYLHGPNIICFIFNLTLYVLTLSFITRDRLKIAKLKRSSANSKYSRFFRYFRLMVLMGMGWLIDICTYLSKMILKNETYKVLDIIFSLQGVCIFVLFVLRRRVIKMIRLRFRNDADSRADFVSRTMSSVSDRRMHCTDISPAIKTDYDYVVDIQCRK